MELSANKLKKIAEGANSRIFLYGESDSAVVLKLVDADANKETNHLKNQYLVLKEIAHPNIIMPLKLKRNVSVQLEDGERMSNILVLEWAERGSLLDLVKQNCHSVREIRELFCQLCEAVEYLHCNYIVHRDIKLENVLISIVDSQLTVKLADFGFAASCSKEDSVLLFNSYKGTKRGYMAPEIHAVLKQEAQPYDARKSDVFALGVVMFCLVLGRLPFEYATKQNKMYLLIAQEKYEEFWRCHVAGLASLEAREPNLVQQFKQLFISMVHSDPDQRPEMDAVLENQWLRGPRSKINAQ